MVVYDSSGLSHNAFALPDRQPVIQGYRSVPFAVQDFPAAYVFISGIVYILFNHF